MMVSIYFSLLLPDVTSIELGKTCPHQSSQWTVLGFKNDPHMLQQKGKVKKNVYWICRNSVWLFIHLLINTLKMQCTHVTKSLSKDVHHNQLTYHNIPCSPQCHMTENWLIITCLYTNDFLVYTSKDSLVADQNAKTLNADLKKKKQNLLLSRPVPWESRMSLNTQVHKVSPS